MINRISEMICSVPKNKMGPLEILLGAIKEQALDHMTWRRQLLNLLKDSLSLSQKDLY